MKYLVIGTVDDRDEDSQLAEELQTPDTRLRAAGSMLCHGGYDAGKVHNLIPLVWGGGNDPDERSTTGVASDTEKRTAMLVATVLGETIRALGVETRDSDLTLHQYDGEGYFMIGGIAPDKTPLSIVVNVTP